MAGYMSKLANYIFDGECKAAAAVADGHLVTLGNGTATEYKPSTADANTTAIVVEAADGNGLTRLRITGLSTALYFVEGADANARTFAIDAYTPYGTGEEDVFAANAYVRCHPLEVGEEICTDNLAAAKAVGASVSIAASTGKWA